MGCAGPAGDAHPGGSIVCSALLGERIAWKAVAWTLLHTTEYVDAVTIVKGDAAARPMDVNEAISQPMTAA